MSNEMETRTVNAPRTGTKVSLILAASLLAVAVYYYTLPTHFQGKDGGIFGCGSPMSPNNNALGKSQCHIIESVGLHKALLFLALALICAVLGGFLFGIEKAQQRRGERSRLDDEDVDDEDVEDDDDDHDEDERAPRSGLLSGRTERRKRPAKSSRRPRLGDEDDEFDEDDEPVRVRTKRTRRIIDEDDDDFGEHDEHDDEVRPARKKRTVSRYEADGFDDARA